MSPSKDGINQRYVRTGPSCEQCQRLKKKCDRQRPTCALCLRRGRRCSFMELRNLSVSSDLPSSDISHSSSAQNFKSSITATYFLDAVLLARSISQLPEVSFSPDPALLNFLGDFRNDHKFIPQYFTEMHPWMPFLSRKTFMERTFNPLGSPWPCNVLLLAAMKLLMIAPAEPDPRSTHYIAIRANVSAAVDAGLLELRIFQTMLLVAVYELGHGIYPTAYVTVGMCSRYGDALGLSQFVESSSGHLKSDIQAEEQRRSWWTILLLDKYLSLGFATRKPATTCPGTDAILPTDDEFWEKPDHAQFQVHRLSEPLSAGMGRFCLTAHVAVLLERILQNISDKSSQDLFREQEAKVLDNTVAALTSLALQEARSRGFNVCSPITACYSARMLLHDPERTLVPRPSLWSDDPSYSATTQSEIAGAMLQIARATTSMHCGEEDYTPFCFEAQYRAGVFFARRYHTTRDHEDLDALETIKKMLAMVSSRWRVAGLYNQMLEARHLSGIL